MYDDRVNEVSLIFYGRPEGLNSALLLNLNVIEFREETFDFKGLFILENKFGKEVLRKLSLDFSETSGDWLVYRYLSEEEMKQLNNAGDERRIYVLLQNYVTLEYFQSLVAADNPLHFFIAGTSEGLKSINAIRDRFKPRNLLIAKNIKKTYKSASEESVTAVPEILAIILKLLLNPVDEMGRISQDLMHSNRRVLYRFAELISFFRYLGVFVFKVFGIRMYWKAIDFSNFISRVRVRVVDTVYYKILHRTAHFLWMHVISPLYYSFFHRIFMIIYMPLEKWVYYKGVHRLFYMTISGLGNLWENVLSPFYFSTIHKFFHNKLKPVFTYIYFKILLLAYYNSFHKIYHRVLKPAFSFIYFQSVHRLYHDLLKPAFSFIYFQIVHRFYHDLLKPAGSYVYFHSVHLTYHRVIVPAYTFLFYGVFSWIKFNIFIRLYNFAVYRVWHFILYRIWHYVLIANFKFYGLCYDLVMFVARITKLYLMYPFFKIYWFASFQYNKRIKKFFA